jgi:hypothetical protein
MSTALKPELYSSHYAEWFKDPDVIAAYPSRPQYAPATIEFLSEAAITTTTPGRTMAGDQLAVMHVAALRSSMNRTTVSWLELSGSTADPRDSIPPALVCSSRSAALRSVRREN